MSMVFKEGPEIKRWWVSLTEVVIKAMGLYDWTSSLWGRAQNRHRELIP